MATESRYNINVTTTGVDAAAAKLAAVEKGLGGIAKAAGLAGAAYFGASGILAAGKYAINQALEAETAEKKLTTALGRKSQALLDYSMIRMRATVYDDDATVAAMAQAAMFTKDEAIIKRVTAAAQDLATAKGLDLVSAEEMVTRAVFGSATALQKMGLNIEGAAGSSTRLESVLGLLQKRFGGQAVAEVETYAGSLKQLKNEADNASQKVGEFLLRVGGGVAKYGRETAEGFDVTREFKEFAAMLDRTVVPAFYKLLEVAFDPRWEGGDFKGVRAWMKQTSDAFKTETDPIIEQSRRTAEAIREFRTTHDTTSDLPVTQRGPQIDPDLLAFREGRAAADQADRDAAAVALRERIEFETREFNMVAAWEDRVRALGEALVEVQETQADIDVSADPTGGGFVAWMEAGQRAIEKRKAATKAALHEEALARTQMVGSALGAFAQLNAAMKGNMTITRRLLQAQAIMDTYAGADRALGAYPPPWSFIAAAAVIAQGLANVAAIQAQGFASGGWVSGPGGSRSDAVPARLSAGERVLSVREIALMGGRGAVDALARGGVGGGITVNFSGPVTDRAYVQDFIIPEIKRAVRLSA
jgi:hypothetical protein